MEDVCYTMRILPPDTQTYATISIKKIYEILRVASLYKYNKLHTSHPVFIYSKLTTERLGQGVKYVRC